MQFFTVTKMLGALVTLSSIATCATLPAAVASRDVNSRSNTDLTTNTTLPPMEWVGSSKGKNITLYGDASSIIAQLKDLDSDWVPNDIPKTPNNTADDTHDVDARQVVTLVSTKVPDQIIYLHFTDIPSLIDRPSVMLPSRKLGLVLRH